MKLGFKFDKSTVKNRRTLGIICIMLSLIICFGITPLFDKAIREHVQIVRVTKNIRRGSAITNDMVSTVSVGGYNLPRDVSKSKEAVVGKFAKADFAVGDYILAGKLSSTPISEFAYLSDLDGKKLAISVSVKSFAAGLSGKLEAGDIVRVMATDVGDFRDTLAPPELQFVKILAVTDGRGYDKDQASKKSDEEKELPASITLLATMEQAKILAELESQGKIHCALVFRGSEKKAGEFLQVQDKMLGLQPKTEGALSNEE